MSDEKPTLPTAFKLAYDSLVRTYIPIIAGATLAWLASWLIIPDELEAFVYILLSALFAALWYLIARLLEIVTQRASRLLTLGLVKSSPPAYRPKH